MALPQVPFCQASLHRFCRHILLLGDLGMFFSVNVAACGGAVAPVSALLISVGSWLRRAPWKAKPQAIRRKGLVATSSICACKTTLGTLLMGWEQAPAQHWVCLQHPSVLSDFILTSSTYAQVLCTRVQNYCLPRASVCCHIPEAEESRG